MTRSVIHILLHFFVPAVVAKSAYADNWKRVWLIMVSTMVIDLDHLLADPVYDPNRCGINFHPFHSYYAIAGYILLALVGQTRIVGLGLLIHVILDGVDCLMLNFGDTD